MKGTREVQVMLLFFEIYIQIDHHIWRPVDWGFLWDYWQPAVPACHVEELLENKMICAAKQ